VLTLSLFAGAANAFAAMLLFDLPGRPVVGLLTVLAGIAGVTCSARIYIVRARPAWCSSYTIAEFCTSALLLGPMLVASLAALLPSGNVPAWVGMAALAGAAGQLITQVLRFLWLSRSESFELRGSSLLLSGPLQNLFLARLGALMIAGVILPLIAPEGWWMAAAFTVALIGEWLGRYLFFVSVVPKNIAAAFTSGERAAA